jgi:uncharacterized protein involved in exopolysaccharide biosynthesis
MGTMAPMKTKISALKPFRRILEVAFVLNFLLAGGLFIFERLSTRHAKEHEPEFKERVAELQGISDSLKRLSDYVASQQESLTTTAQSLERLRSEKDQMEAALHIDRDQLRSLAVVLDQQSKASKWVDRALGFLVGTFSSLLAAFIWEKFRKPQSESSV